MTCVQSWRVEREVTWSAAATNRVYLGKVKRGSEGGREGQRKEEKGKEGREKGKEGGGVSKYILVMSGRGG